MRRWRDWGLAGWTGKKWRACSLSVFDMYIHIDIVLLRLPLRAMGFMALRVPVAVAGLRWGGKTGCVGALGGEKLEALGS